MVLKKCIIIAGCSMAVIMENYVMLQACSVSMTVRSVDVVQAVLGFSCGELC